MSLGKVLTIFSASSYYEVGSNRGAYCKIQGPDLQCHVVQFLSNRSPALRKITFTQRVNLIEHSALLDLKSKVIASKTELNEEFRKYDKENTGKICSADWGFAMETVLEMELPWRTLRSKLAKCDEKGLIEYNSTFAEMQVRHRYSGNGPSITETLYKHKESLETIFRLMDSDHSGCISMQEFEDGLTILIRQLDINIQPTDIQDIAKSLDINKDGFIDFNEFLEAFRIVDNYGKDKTAKMSRCESIHDEELVTPEKTKTDNDFVCKETLDEDIASTDA